MNEVVSKLSAYSVFNYLVPGAAFCLLMSERGLLDVGRIDVASRLILFYVVGMSISRVGSLIVDPVLRRAKLIPRSNYGDYVRASAGDDKVPVLLESSNTYRTMTSGCAIGFFVYLASIIVPSSWLTHDAAGCIALAAMGCLFAIAYIKQNKAVTRRVRANIAALPANDVTAQAHEATA